MVNIEEPQFDEPREGEGFTCKRARVGRQAGAERLGSASGRSRRAGGRGGLEKGRSCRSREARRERTRSSTAASDAIRFLAFSTSGDPDIVLQFDSGKVGAFERRPDGGGLRVWFRREDAVGYFEGESAPG